MSDKEAVRRLGDKLRETLRRQSKVKKIAKLAATEKEDRERQERP